MTEVRMFEGCVARTLTGAVFQACTKTSNPAVWSGIMVSPSTPIPNRPETKDFRKPGCVYQFGRNCVDQTWTPNEYEMEQLQARFAEQQA